MPDNGRFVLQLFGHFKTKWISTENIFAEPQRNGKMLQILTKVIKVNLSLQLEEVTIFRCKLARCVPSALRSQILKEKLNKCNQTFTIATDHEAAT